MPLFPPKKSQIILLAATIVATFFLVYWPHISYPFPYHVDEWHHIAQGLRLGNYGEYFEALKAEGAQRFNGMEIGFHTIIFLSSFIISPVLFYQYFPALWTVFSAVALFYVVWERSRRDFLTAWLAVVFFVSIKSNVNLAGLWFFTPLSFSIPLIFLYIHFFAKGLEEENRKFIWVALGMMIFLVPTHSLSVLFSLPALAILSIMYRRYIFREYKFFLFFIIIPVVGIIFYKYTLDVPWGQIVGHLLTTLMFKKGWGVLEVKNSLMEVYSWVGYLLAATGVIFIVTSRNAKEYAIFLIWPMTMFILVLIYRAFGISFISPYQRNLYYLVIALPFLSAIGLRSVINLLNKEMAKVKPSLLLGGSREKVVAGIIIGFTVVLLFGNYYNTPTQLGLYKVINQDDYEALVFLARLPRGVVMATPFISTAMYPITQNNPVGDLAFYGDRSAVERFFLNNTCQSKLDVIKSKQVDYVVSPLKINCGLDLIYQKNGNYIYKIH